jgi:hypothetical protein
LFLELTLDLAADLLRGALKLLARGRVRVLQRHGCVDCWQSHYLLSDERHTLQSNVRTVTVVCFTVRERTFSASNHPKFPLQIFAGDLLWMSPYFICFVQALGGCNR